MAVGSLSSVLARDLLAEHGELAEELVSIHQLGAAVHNSLLGGRGH